MVKHHWAGSRAVNVLWSAKAGKEHEALVDGKKGQKYKLITSQLTWAMLSHKTLNRTKQL